MYLLKTTIIISKLLFFAREYNLKLIEKKFNESKKFAKKIFNEFENKCFN